MSEISVNAQRKEETTTKKLAAHKLCNKQDVPLAIATIFLLNITILWQKKHEIKCQYSITLLLFKKI